MNNITIESLAQILIDQLDGRNHGLNGWIAAGVSATPVVGKFSGIKVLQGAAATVTLLFESPAVCNVNSQTITLVEGDYLPTPGCNSVTVSAGKVILFKAQQ